MPLSEKTIPEPDGDAPAEKPRNKGGRPRGSRSKIGGRVPNPCWLRDLVETCLPREEYERRFRSLTPFEQFTIAARLAPKDMRVDQQANLKFLINGIPLVPVLGRTVQALPASSDAVIDAHEDYNNSGSEDR